MGDLLAFSPNTLSRLRRPRRGLLRAKTADQHYEQGLALEDTAPDRAIAAYRRALLSRPMFADAHCNLGRLLHEQGQLGLAESHYRLALTCDSEVALYWFNLGVVVEDRRGRCAASVGEAIDAYHRALALDPAMTDAHYNLARIYEQLGRQSNDELMQRRAIRHLASYRQLQTRAGASS